MKIFIDISHNPSVYFNCKQKIVHNKGKRKEMKKALAVLVIMMVALTSVFAGRTLTLTTSVNNVAPTLEVYYGDAENPSVRLGKSQTDNTVSLEKGVPSNRYFTVKLSGNSSVDVDNLSVTFTNSSFVLVDAENKPIENASGIHEVATRLVFTAEDNPTGATVEVTNGEDSKVVDVDYKAYNKIENEKVASGVLSWTNDKDLVAGKYLATVTVTVSTDN